MATDGKESGSDSSDEETIVKVKKLTKKRRIIDTTDSDSDSNFGQIRRKNIRRLNIDSDVSDNDVGPGGLAEEPTSEDERAEKCAICLGPFIGQDLATPESCDHTFCFLCLRHWTKTANSCPIDRLKYNLVLLRHHNQNKVFRSVTVKRLLTWRSDSENDSEVEDAFCRGCKRSHEMDSLLPCSECNRPFHPTCLVRSWIDRNSRICPFCALYNRHCRFRTNSSYEPQFVRTRAALYNAHQRQHSSVLQYIRRRLLTSSSSSESSDEEQTHLETLQLFNPVNASMPTLKPLTSVHRPQNRALVSTSLSSNADMYHIGTTEYDSDEYRAENSDSFPNHSGPSSSSSFQAGQSRDRIVQTQQTENFDVVGSILQSQTLLHRADVLKLSKDGSLQLGSDATIIRNASSLPSPIKEEKLNDSPTFSNPTPGIPAALEGVYAKQTPQNPTQNTNVTYRDTPRDYTCPSSTSKESTINYDEISFSARSLFESNGNNENSGSSALNKNFCSPSGIDDIDKKLSNCKDPNRSQHSEEEVDIYSDIESVADEGVSNTIDSVTERLVEPLDIPFKDVESPVSNREPASDSSDNELVIDEDMAADEESERQKDNIAVSRNIVCENETAYDADESQGSQISCSGSLGPNQSDKRTETHSDINSNVDSRSVDNSSQLGEECSQENNANTSDVSPVQKSDSEYEECKDESESDEKSECRDEKSRSDGETNDSEDRNKIRDDTKYESDEKNQSECDSENINATENINVEDQNSNMDVQACDENSVGSSRKSLEETNVAYSPISSPKVSDKEHTSLDAEMKEVSLDDTNDHSASSDVQELEYVESRKHSNVSSVSPVPPSDNTNGSSSQVDENSNFSFVSSQNISETEEPMETEIHELQTSAETCNKDVNSPVHNETKYNEDKNSMSENEISNDNVDYSENVGTPCLDENIEGQSESSPTCDIYESAEQTTTSNLSDVARKTTSSSDCEIIENDNLEDKIKEPVSDKHIDDDLGIEDISEAGSGDLDDDFPDDAFSDSKENIYNANKCLTKIDDLKHHTSSHSNQSFEEGEIVEDKPIGLSVHKNDDKFKHNIEENINYVETAHRVNVASLPRIPKIKRNREKDSEPRELQIETKRTSVLGRVDLDDADVNWKRLSKHTRDRSYRDGKPKEDKMLFRERESRKKDKKDSSDNEWHSDSKSRRRSNKKRNIEKVKDEYQSRSRKAEKRESKASDWDYSDRDSHKNHKDKHKEKHKDKKDKGKRDKYSKDDRKHGRDRSRDDTLYERQLKVDKEKKYERVGHEKGKCKDRDHKSKHKEKKSESKNVKEQIYEKHKHIHVSDHFSDKQKNREVRKIDDKLKIVVEQKDGRKDSSKHNEKKEPRIDSKLVQIEQKKDVKMIPFSELTSIESKEIFAKGDSIIINVNFNRTLSPKESTVENTDSLLKEKKIEEYEIDLVSPDKPKKHLSDKIKSSLDTSVTKRPTTPPERSKPVLSVSESYWQGNDDSDANNSQDSMKSLEEIAVTENTMESTNQSESNSYSSNNGPEAESATNGSVLENEPKKAFSQKEDKSDHSFSKENESVVSTKRRSPRSPSPPSPADNDSYDPCEPTRSPSPPPMPPAPPLPVGNPKPPPSPELPPLPPEPEPEDTLQNETIHKRPSEFVIAPSISTSSQHHTVNAPASLSVTPISMSNMLIPPPNFPSANSLSNLASLIPSNFNFQLNNRSNILYQPNHVQQVIHGIPTNQIQSTSLPPPPNPPSLPNMTSVPPPPPPPTAMGLLSQLRPPPINVRPAITPSSILQSLTMGHSMSQMQMAHMSQHMPPNFNNSLSNHQPQMMISSQQNQPLNIPVTIQNQTASNIVMQPLNQILNHSATLHSQNLVGKPLGTVLTHQSLSNNIVHQRLDKTENSEVVDMDVESPYSPGNISLSVDSVCDYSPTASPVLSTPKHKDIFDSLLITDFSTPIKRIYETMNKAEKSKHTKDSNKRTKHEHKKHSVRMQVSDKSSSRKERKAEKKLDDSQLKILDELPNSAVEMQVKEKFLKKLNRQERVVEEVKMALKPYYKSRDVTKEEYKDILRRSVPKICHNRSGSINPLKVKSLVDSYIKKVKFARKKGDKKNSLKLS